MQATFSTVVCCNSIVRCNSVSADRSGMAASRFLAAAAAGVILVSFASESRKSHCSGCMSCEWFFGSNFFHFATDNFPLTIPLKSASESSFFRFLCASFVVQSNTGKYFAQDL